MTTPSAGPVDPYFYPGTRVLRNNYDIRDPTELAEAEDDISYEAMYRLEQQPVAGNFDLPHLQRVHHAIWGRLYPWAGEIRTVGIAKGGAPFCAPGDIVEAADQIFDNLAEENTLRGLPISPFAERLSSFHGAINYLHPFREGNGRAQRAFLGQLAREAGYDLRWDRLDPAVNDYASQAHRTLRTAEPMRQVMEELVVRRWPLSDAERPAEANRLSRLATQVRASARQFAQQADQLRADAEAGRGQHVTELFERRAALNRSAEAIHTLHNARLNGTPMTAEHTTRFRQTAGPHEGWSDTLLEHRTLINSWERLHEASQGLDELAPHQPEDLARRQHQRADRIRERASALRGIPRPNAANSVAEQLRAARRTAEHTPDPDPEYRAEPLDAHADHPEPSLEPPAHLPPVNPPQPAHMDYRIDGAGSESVDFPRDDGLDAGA